MKITRAQLKQIIKEELQEAYDIESDVRRMGPLSSAERRPPPEAATLRVPENPDADRNYEELVSALGDVLRRSLDEHGMQPDEVRSAVEEALGVHLGSDEGKIMAHAGLASDRYEREERAIRRAGPKGRIPFDPSLYDED